MSFPRKHPDSYPENLQIRVKKENACHILTVLKTHIVHGNFALQFCRYNIIIRSFCGHSGSKWGLINFSENWAYLKVTFIMRIKAVLCSGVAERERDIAVTKKLKFNM